MRRRHRQLLITFSTTMAAMELEQRAAQRGIAGRLIPLPSEISAGCGLAWKCELTMRREMLDFMQTENLHWEMLYELELF